MGWQLANAAHTAKAADYDSSQYRTLHSTTLSLLPPFLMNQFVRGFGIARLEASFKATATNSGLTQLAKMPGDQVETCWASNQTSLIAV